MERAPSTALLAVEIAPLRFVPAAAVAEVNTLLATPPMLVAEPMTSLTTIVDELAGGLMESSWKRGLIVVRLKGGLTYENWQS